MLLKYRPEIDGLRAVAVLPVIFFHAGSSRFVGGFVGVDVFFVISGYLITSIIVKDVEAGKFSFWAFYERRARRILPALFLVMLCCIPFAWKWMLPMEMKAFSTSVVSVCLFFSNILFWQQSGYFEPAAELKPLLHTWSVAVEEQYYLVFPVAILLLWQFGRVRVIRSIALVAVLSLALSEYASHYHPSANFYLLPTRAWELMAGALCSFAAFKPNVLRDNALSAAGLAAIIFSVFWFNRNDPFPSLFALLPVLGTCSIILFARNGTLIRWLLALRPIVGIGLMSYSAYLWHQPLFAFARIRSPKEPSLHVMLGLCCVTLVLAYLSWRFVEVPARRRGAMPLPSRAVAFSALGAIAAVFIAFGSAGDFSNGFPSRLPDELVSLSERTAINYGLSADCDEEFRPVPNCRTSEEPEILLWGDSYAMHLLDGLRASNPHLAIVQMTESVCGPFVGIAPIGSGNFKDWARKCLAFNDEVLNFARKTKSLRYAVLSSPFGQFVGDDVRVLTREGAIVPGRDAALSSFKKTLDALIQMGIKPIVFAPPPTPGFDAGKCLLNTKQFRLPVDSCTFSRAGAVQRQRAVRLFLTEIARDYDVVWFDDLICKGDDCSASRNGTFIYRDRGHLSHEGSAYLGREMNFYGLIAGGSESRN